MCISVRMVGGGGRILLKLAVVLATVASVLVPAWVAPARTISTPVTLARSVELDQVLARRTAGAIPLSIRPTHVAFSWSGSEEVTVSYRTDPSGRWTEAPIAHDADTPTHHYTGLMSVDRPARLQWKAVPAPGAIVSDLTLDYLNTLDGPRVSTEIGRVGEAGAAVRTPKIVTRAEWGADESVKRTSGGCKRRFHPVQQLFVHHTAGSNFDNRPKSTMRAIYWYHVVRQGWCDIGYNFVISHDGQIFEGRWARRYGPWETHDGENRAGEAVVGAHVDGYNSGSVGISLMGNFQRISPSPAARRSLARVLAWEVDRHDLHARGTHEYRNPETGHTRTLPWIAGHRDADATSCPGDRLYRSLNGVRRDAVAVMGQGKTSTSVTATASAPRINYGEKVTIAGTLTDATGAGLPSRTIHTYQREGTRAWKAGPSGVTGPDGTFAFTAKPRANLRFAVVYEGDGGTWGSDREVKVKVAPIVTLETRNGSVDGSGVAHYAAGTRKVPFAGSVLPAHPNDDVRVFVSKMQLDGSYDRVDSGSAEIDSDGTFLFAWSVVDPGAGGTYQAYALFTKDDDHARGISPVVTFVIDPEP